MIPKELGLAWCGTGQSFYLQYFIKHRFETRRLTEPVTKAQMQIEVLIITLPNGQEQVIKDRAITVGGKLTIFHATDAIYRLPKEER